VNLVVSRVILDRDFGGTHVKKALMLSAAAVFGLATAGHAEEMAYAKKPASPLDAMAADMPYKAEYKKAPAVVDDSLTWHGITLSGQIDMGLTYNSHGAPASPLGGVQYNYFPVANSQGPIFGLGSNQLSGSFVALRGKQEIADGLYAIFALQTNFNPNSGTISNGFGTIVQNNGLALSHTNAFGDSNGNGQAFNGGAYAGLSSPVYGTFTYGRQTALTHEGVVNYDPLASSGAFSAVGFFGATAGVGDTEERRWDNALKYTVGVGPLRFAAEAMLGAGQFSGSQGNAFEGEFGFDYAGFSFDVIGSRILDAVSASTMSSGQLIAATTGVNPVGTFNGTGSAIGQGLGLVQGNVSDNTGVMLLAKYNIGPVKLFAGYEHIDQSNPNNPLSVGSFLPGGYVLGAANNNAFNTDKITQTFWTGAKYAATSSLDLILAYYHIEQNSWAGVTRGNSGSAVSNTNVTANCNNASSGNCSGALDAISFVADWRFARHFDAYAGVVYSQVANGFASGFLSVKPGSSSMSEWAPSAGLKYSF
jgi:predicted porin